MVLFSLTGHYAIYAEHALVSVPVKRFFWIDFVLNISLSAAAVVLIAWCHARWGR